MIIRLAGALLKARLPTDMNGQEGISTTQLNIEGNRTTKYGTQMNKEREMEKLETGKKSGIEQNLKRNQRSKENR